MIISTISSSSHHHVLRSKTENTPVSKALGKKMFPQARGPKQKVSVTINLLLNKFCFSPSSRTEVFFFISGDIQDIPSTDSEKRRKFSIRLRTKLIFIAINYLRLSATRTEIDIGILSAWKGFASICRLRNPTEAKSFSFSDLSEGVGSMRKLQLYALFVWLISWTVQADDSDISRFTLNRIIWRWILASFTSKPGFHSRLLIILLYFDPLAEPISCIEMDTFGKGTEVPFSARDNWNFVNNSCRQKSVCKWEIICFVSQVGKAQFTSIKTRG